MEQIWVDCQQRYCLCVHDVIDAMNDAKCSKTIVDEKDLVKFESVIETMPVEPRAEPKPVFKWKHGIMDAYNSIFNLLTQKHEETSSYNTFINAHMTDRGELCPSYKSDPKFITARIAYKQARLEYKYEFYTWRAKFPHWHAQHRARKCIKHVRRNNKKIQQFGRDYVLHADAEEKTSKKLKVMI